MPPTNKEPVKILWCVYNHLPGGQLVAMHFDTYTRKKKTGPDSTEEVLFTADAQLEAWKKSDCVALKLKGQELVKGKLLVYPENLALPRDPANTVIAWAIKQGAEPYRNPNEAVSKKEGSVVDPEQQKKIEALEKDVADLKQGQEQTNDGIKAILEKLNAPKGSAAHA